MPPEYPRKPKNREHLYKLLRPEFVARYKKPLCPDALSGFTISDPGMSTHNREIEKATAHLYKEVIPRVAANLDQMAKKSSEKAMLFHRLTEHLHSAGVNLRHMGMIRSKVTDPFVRRFLLVEMCSRVI